MERAHGRRARLAAVLIVGVWVLSACADDDGSRVRDLTREPGIPGSASGASASPTP